MKQPPMHFATYIHYNPGQYPTEVGQRVRQWLGKPNQEFSEMEGTVVRFGKRRTKHSMTPVRVLWDSGSIATHERCRLAVINPNYSKEQGVR